MEWLKKIFGQEEPDLPPPPSGLFGLRLGCALEIDDLEFRVMADELLLEFPAQSQLVEAAGFLELGAGSRIRRYYTGDDCYIQVSTTGAESETNLEDFKFFAYDDSVAPGTDAEWDEWLDARTIGALTYEYRGKTFRRAFNVETDGPVPPIALPEKIENTAGDKYTVDNFMMLYERELTDSVLEYLLITAEESNDGRTISFALGVDLSPNQLKVIG